MNLKEKLLDELKVAMREKDTVKKNTLQLARAAVLQYEKDNRTTLDDDGIVNVIAKEVKKYKDALPEYEKSGRQDLIDELKRKINILMPYLPSQLSEEEIQKIVDECIATVRKTKRNRLFLKILGHSSRNRRCDIRSQNQCRTVSVYELVHIT